MKMLTAYERISQDNKKSKLFGGLCYKHINNERVWVLLARTQQFY
jgi:hypothetical protein